MPDLELPPALVEAVKDQRVVLFLGSGASHGAKHPQGKAIPLGDNLRDLICDRFLGGALISKPLTVVAAMAANEAGFVPFQKFIYDLLEPFQPAAHHLLLPTFRWRAIATTNVDLIVERAYTATSALQKIVRTVKDGDLFDQRLNEVPNPLGYYKLHGCIESYTDAAIPLILSTEQYASYELNRGRLYNRFRDLGYEYPIIFVGYSISDPHIQRLLFDLTSPTIGRPPYYVISPQIDPIETRYWASHRVVCLSATFADFLTTLDTKIAATARAVPVSYGGGALSIRTHYRAANASESSALASYLSTDVTHVHGAMAASAQSPAEFYAGNENGFGCILQNLDAKRAITDSILIDAVLTGEDSQRASELYMLKGPAGNGKTVTLKRVAWEAATTYEQLVLFADSPAGIRIDPLEEIFQLTGKRTILVVDRVALVRREVRDVLRQSRARRIPLTVIGAERDGEWNTYCEPLETYLRQEFPVRYLSETEIKELLSLLERHNALGILKDASPADRFLAFAKRAERQLLVALHEATRGIAFEDIVLDEYEGIQSETAQRLYLSICALHQFGAPVRAGLISRTSGITFDRFRREFIEPLENIVLVIEDRHTKDIYYRARHQHVAEILFTRALPKPEEKFDFLSDLVAAINVDYTSDRETFIRMIRGRGIVDLFPSIELGRLFYDRIEHRFPRDPFVGQQRAIFELNHAGGSLEQAEAAAQRAFELHPTNRSIMHTQGEVARRLANETDDPLRKQVLRKLTREKIGGELSRLSEYDLYTAARLAIDEFKDELDVLPEGAATPPSTFFDAVKHAELAIQRGLQQFPESSELLTAESTFRELLNQTQRAQQALEKAFWPAPGSADTELGVLMEPEVCHGATEVYTGVQA
jgi:hypothetical protein